MFNIPTVTIASRNLAVTESSVTLNVDTSALSFTPRHLVLRMNAAANTGTELNFVIRFNGDSGTNYSHQRLVGNDGSASAARATDATSLNHVVFNGSGMSDFFSGGEILMPDALSTRSHKSHVSFSGIGEEQLRGVAGRWANTAAITSVTWASSAGSFIAGSTFELCVVDESFNIDEQILGSDGKFTVSSISGANGDLVCIGNLRVTATGQTEDHLHMQFNGDTTSSNYARQYLRGKATAVSAATGSDALQGMAPASNAGTSIFGAFVAQVTNYSDGSNDRVATSLAGFHADATFANVMATSGRWNNTAAITEIFLHGNAGAVEEFLAGSMLSTYAVPKNLIERQELSGTASSVTFSSIPQTYDHLELSIYVRGDSSGQPEAGFRNEFNGDTTVANYKRQHLIAYGTTVGAGTGDNNTPVDFPTATATANVFGYIAYSIQNYTKTDRHKHYMVTAGDAGENEIRVTSNRWANTAAVTSIVFTPTAGNFIAGSVFTLRGIKKPASAAAAGDMTSVSGVAVANITAVN